MSSTALIPAQPFAIAVENDHVAFQAYPWMTGLPLLLGNQQAAISAADADPKTLSLLSVILSFLHASSD
jgi:hypothetical protein